jgi:hypothetical protein
MARGVFEVAPPLALVGEMAQKPPAWQRPQHRHQFRVVVASFFRLLKIESLLYYQSHTFPLSFVFSLDN